MTFFKAICGVSIDVGGYDSHFRMFKTLQREREQRDCIASWISAASLLLNEWIYIFFVFVLDHDPFR